MAEVREQAAFLSSQLVNKEKHIKRLTATNWLSVDSKSWTFKVQNYIYVWFTEYQFPHGCYRALIGGKGGQDDSKLVSAARV